MALRQGMSSQPALVLFEAKTAPTNSERKKITKANLLWYFRYPKTLAQAERFFNVIRPISAEVEAQAILASLKGKKMPHINRRHADRFDGLFNNLLRKGYFTTRTTEEADSVVTYKTSHGSNNAAAAVRGDAQI